MKKNLLLFLLPALFAGESLHAQRKSDYRDFSVEPGLYFRQQMPTDNLLTRQTTCEMFIYSNAPEDCFDNLMIKIIPLDKGNGDWNQTLSLYPNSWLSSKSLVEMLTWKTFSSDPEKCEIIHRRLSECKSHIFLKVSDYNQIGEELFINTPALEQAEIGSGVRHLLKGTFRDCKNLKYVKFGPNVIKIDQDCLLGCSSLEVVEFENSDVNSVTNILGDIKYMFHTVYGQSAQYCTNMKAFVVPDPLVSVWKSVLDNVFKPVKDGTCRVMSKSEFYSPYVTGVIINTFPVILLLDSTYQLTASVLPPNAWNRNVIWSSKDPSIVDVSSTGLLTAKGYGTTQITATSEENTGKMFFFSVTVPRPTN